MATSRFPDCFEFTALTGDTLLADGDTRLGLGDSFAMPQQSNAVLSVADNDAFLSGDRRRNEVGDDLTGQRAEITVDGVPVFDRVRVYAEQALTVEDENGNQFTLIQIETRGNGATSADDFFAFLGDVPASGAELTVVGTANVTGRSVRYDALSGEATDPNAVPEITSDGGGDMAEVSVDENTTAVTDVEATDDADAEGAGLIYSITGGADQAAFEIDPDTGALAFLTPPDFEAPGDADGDNTYEVEVTVTDSRGLTDVQTLTVTVTDVAENAAPVITSDGGGEVAQLEVAENTTAITDVEATDDADAEGAGLSYAISGGTDEAAFDIDAGTGALSFIAPPDFEMPGSADGDNEFQVQVTVTDSGGLNDVQTITVTVTDVAENAAPVITSDGGGDTAEVRVNENTAAVTDVEASDDVDSEGAGLVYSITGGADQAAFDIDPDTGALAFLTPPDFEAPGDADADNAYDVEVTVTDSGGLTDVQTLTVVVDGVNEPAEFAEASVDVSLAENQTLAFTAMATDPEGDTIGYGIVPAGFGQPSPDAALFTIDQMTGALSFIAPPDFENPGDADGNNIYTVTIGANSDQSSAFQTVNITVTDVAENEAPVITSDGGGEVALIEVAENTTAVTDVETSDDADSEGSGLTYSISGGADDAAFQIDAATGVLSFVSAPDFETPGSANGDNEFEVQVTVTDSGGLTDVQTLAVTVTDVVETPPPDAVGDSFDVIGNVGITVGAAGSILANDTAGTPTGLSFGATPGTAGDTAADGTNTITTANGGTVLLNADGTFTYDPAAGFEGTDSFFYFVSNAGGADTAEVTLNVGNTIWFIDSAAGGSANTGTAADPFTSLAAFDAVNDGAAGNPGAGDAIFLASGSGLYTGGVTLQNDQSLIGEGASGASLDTVLGITLPPFSNALPSIGGTDPVISNASGDAITLASGTTIQGVNVGSASGDGISGTNVSDIAISEVDIANTGVHGIDLNGVANFTYEDGAIVNAGDGDDEHSINAVNLFGTNLIEDVRLDDIADTGIELVNNTTDDGTADSLTIRRLDVEDHDSQATGEDGVFIQASGTANLSVLVDDSDFDINANGAEGVFAISDGNATFGLTIQDSFFEASDSFGSGSFSVVNAGNSTATVVATGNTITDTSGTAIIVNNDDNATSNVTISGNTIGATGGFGLQLRQDGNGTQTALIDDNDFGASTFGTVFLNARDGSGTLNATVTNNTANAAPSSGFGPGLAVTSEDSNTLNASITGNTFTGNNGFPGTEDIALTENNASALNIAQVSALALSTANNSASVGVTGTPQFGQSAPPTPPAAATTLLSAAPVAEVVAMAAERMAADTWALETDAAADDFWFANWAEEAQDQGALWVDLF